MLAVAVPIFLAVAVSVLACSFCWHTHRWTNIQFFNNLSATTSVPLTTTTSNSETTFVKRSYIEKQYPFELATFFLYQKDFDRMYLFFSIFVN